MLRPATRSLPVLVAAGLLAAACSAAPATSDAPTAPEAAPSATGAATPTPTEPTVPPLHPSVDDWESAAVEIVGDDGTRHPVAVRIASTPVQRQHGLMEVPELPDGVGMWFPYADDHQGGFWMKNTLVPLDIVYVGADDRVVDVADAVPCTADPCPTYTPSGTYRNVLEVPAGTFDRLGAGPGSVVRLVAS